MAWMTMFLLNCFSNVILAGNCVGKFRGDDYCDPECTQYIRPGNLKYMVLYYLDLKTFIIGIFIGIISNL